MNIVHEKVIQVFVTALFVTALAISIEFAAVLAVGLFKLLLFIGRLL